MKRRLVVGSIVRYVGAQHPKLAGFEGVAESVEGDRVKIRFVQSRKGGLVPAELVNVGDHEVRVLRGHSKRYLNG